MKSFQEFQEQIEQAQEKQKRDKAQNKAYIGAQIRAGAKHRSHVHGELAKRAEQERQDMEKRHF